jgi:hypothetical protein
MLIIGALFFYGVDMLVAFASSGLFYRHHDKELGWDCI